MFISTSPFVVVVITNVFQTTFETEQIILQYGQMITTEKTCLYENLTRIFIAYKLSSSGFQKLVKFSQINKIQ